MVMFKYSNEDDDDDDDDDNNNNNNLKFSISLEECKTFSPKNINGTEVLNLLNYRKDSIREA